jgi:phage shock protein PspC (stress-responsive transcriptional regulator)
MNKVITIHLNGVAYQLEEQGYDALQAYLDTAGRRLEGNPDKDEILADIEQAIGDKCRSLLGINKTVIITKEVADIIAEMGPVEDATGASQTPRDDAGAKFGSSEGPRQAANAGAAHAPKRLYKIREGAKIAGVCNGIAAYLNIDVTIVRVIFAVLAIGYGTGLMLYLLLMFVLPEAMTPDDMAAAHGTPSATAQEFIRRAREGYYEGMRSFGDKRARREWKRKFKDDMRGWKRDFQREMNKGAGQWRAHWNDPAYGRGFTPGSWYAHSFSGLVLGLLTLACWCCILSLVFTGGVFGFYMPGIPFWLMIILVIAFIKVLKWPFRAMRGPYIYGYGYHCGPFGFLWTALMWIGLIYLFLWFTGGHIGNLHEAWHQLPPKLHHAADSVKQWWDQQ